MIDDLYSARILTLAANLPFSGRLPEPQGTGTRTAKLCGSRAVADVVLADGRVVDFAQDVKACALGQAAAGVLGSAVIGATVEEIVSGRDALKVMLAGGPAPSGRFADLIALDCVRDYPARHASTLVAFEACVDACRMALATQDDTERTRIAGAA